MPEILISGPLVPCGSRKMACIQPQPGNVVVARFVVAAGRHQPDVSQHLPHRQTRSHRLPKLFIGAQALAGGDHETGLKQKTLPEDSVFSNLGAGDEVRTRDLDLGKVALYQLSYSRRRFGKTFVVLNGATKVRRIFREASG